MLATDYTVSEDGLVYTFNLRQGVLFHNGEELKASDVVFTIERCRPSARMYSYVEPIASAEALDDYTVTITLSYQYAPFIKYVGELDIVNEKFVTEVGDDGFATQTCGTGPYMLKEFVQAQSASVTAFPTTGRAKPRSKTSTGRSSPTPQRPCSPLSPANSIMSAFRRPTGRTLSERKVSHRAARNQPHHLPDAQPRGCAV